MKKITVLCLSTFLALNSFAQGEKKYIRKGNKEFQTEKFEEAELQYRKAIEKQAGSVKANYNLGNSLYMQEKFEAAATKFENLTVEKTDDKTALSKYYYNLGNTYFKENKHKQAIEAYKSALRNNPGDADAKHNLQYLQNMMAAMQNQQQQEQQQDQDKNDDKKEQQQQQQQQEQQQDQQQQPQQARQQQISREDAERLLDEIAREEKEVLKKVQEQKAQAKKIPVDKNW